MTESPRILVVDDRPEFCELLRQDLEDEGYLVSVANSGKQCIEIAASFEADVIMLDISMPEMDGFETCFVLKSDPRTCDVPVIFLTGHNSEEGSAMAAIAAGGSDFIEKPYTPNILFSRVSAQLKAKKRIDAYRSVAMRDLETGLFTRGAVAEFVGQLPADASREILLTAGQLSSAPGDWTFPDDLQAAAQTLANAVSPPNRAVRWGARSLGFLLIGATKEEEKKAMRLLTGDVVSRRFCGDGELAIEDFLSNI